MCHYILHLTTFITRLNRTKRYKTQTGLPSYLSHFIARCKKIAWCDASYWQLAKS